MARRRHVPSPERAFLTPGRLPSNDTPRATPAAGRGARVAAAVPRTLDTSARSARGKEVPTTGRGRLGVPGSGLCRGPADGRRERRPGDYRPAASSLQARETLRESHRAKRGQPAGPCEARRRRRLCPLLLRGLVVT